LWVRLDPPEGIPVLRTDAPDLYSEIDAIGKKLKAPPVHEILVTSEFNAALVQHPKLGIMGCQRNFFILGLPLMMALSPQQFRGVLAHEYGHLSGEDGKLAAWIYRMRLSWSRLVASLEESDHWGKVFFVRFFKWYAPFFSRYSMALAQEQEYQADRASAMIAGASPAASALVNCELWSRFLSEEFWPCVHQLADRKADPPETVFKTMALAFRKGLPKDRGRQWLEAAMAEKTDSMDTHPCLKDRLAPLHGRVALEEPLAESAASRWLPSIDALQAELGRQWRKAVTDRWQERFHYVKDAKSDLESLSRKSSTEALSLTDAWRLAELTETFQSAKEAFPRYKQVLRLQPDHPGALFALGRIALANGNPGGADVVEKAMSLDSDLVVEGCQRLQSFYTEVGDKKRARIYANREVKHLETLMLAREERASVRAGDGFLPHGLDAVDRQEIASLMAATQGVQRAYLVQKSLVHFPEKPLYVLAVSRKKARGDQDDLTFSQSVADAIPIQGNVIVFVLAGRNRRFHRSIKETDHSLIFEKSRWTGAAVDPAAVVNAS
jgi:Zn-dependent protease with chaperone function